MSTKKALDDASFAAAKLRRAVREAHAEADSRLLELLLRDVLRDAEQIARRIDEIAEAATTDSTP